MAISEKDTAPESSEEPVFPSKGLNKKKIYLSRLKRKIFKHVWIIRGLILLGALVAFYLAFSATSYFVRRTSIPLYFDLAYNFVFAPEGKIRKIEGRTNILFLGKGGEGHEAPDLTDTMLFVSLSHSEKKITLISLPRDIWIPDLRTKLNSVYYWGNQKEAGGGLVLAKATVEEITGFPVHYVAVLDFSGFRKIVDVLGGLEVDVGRAFVDEKYPIAGRENDLCGGDPEYKCRYETVSFSVGRQVMDGETALKFVRSRNAQGDEGTDFARQERQQKILKAVEQKILSKEIILSPKKLFQIKKVFESSTETDIDESAGAILARIVFESRENIASHVLPEKLLVNPPKSPKYDNLYVFIPANGDWLTIHEWVDCTLKNGDCP